MMPQNEKRLWDEVDLRFGAIDTTNVNRKERERERDNQKIPTHFKYNKYIKNRACMHGECMNM